MKVPVWTLVFAIVASDAFAAAKPKTHETALTPTERWVVTQVVAGEVADLKKQFSEGGKRKLSANFLERLLTGALPAVTIHRNGVRIVGAVVDEPFNLSNAQIQSEVWLDNCTFNKEVDWSGARLTSNVTFEGSTFRGDVSFDYVRSAGSLILSKAIFEGELGFQKAEVANEFWLTEAQCKNEKKANFGMISVGGTLALNKAIFEGSVSFISASVGDLNADSAEFRSKNQVAAFFGMKVARTAFLARVVFEGPSSFSGFDVNGDLMAAQMEFRNNEKNKEAFFYGMRVGQGAYFNKAMFAGSVNFTSANIGDLNLNEAHFKNEEEVATFNGIKVVRTMFLNDTVFEGPVNFVAANVGTQVIANDTRFNSKTQPVEFNSMRVGGAAFFRRAVFEGAAGFGAAEFGGNFEANETQFKNPTALVMLAMKCGGFGSFWSTRFSGPVSFADSAFVDLFLGDAAPERSAISKVDFSRASIKRQLTITNINIGDFVAASLHVDGPTLFNKITVERSADLGGAEFGALDVSNSDWPKEPGAFRLQGMSYKHLRAAPDESESHAQLLKLVNQSAYTADVYGKLEHYFADQGYRSDADRIFIAGKRRERQEYLHGMPWLGSLLLDWLVGYGRRPWQAGIPCALFVTLGCVLFSPSKMEPQKPENAPRIYNRFWYSLDLFLPFVDLKADEVWKPKTDQRFLRHYVRAHVLLGWILIPVLLAAVTGLIK